MLLFNKYNKGRIFLDPNNGPSGGGGGSVGNPGAGQGGTNVDPGATPPEDPFAGIVLDDLDAATRATLEKAKEKFAANAKQLEAERKTREHHEQLARNFQAKHDSLAAQIQRLNGGQQPPSAADAAQQKLIADFKAELMRNGVDEKQADLQAPLMLNMMKTYGETLKAEIGRDMSPFAATVMQQEASNAWGQALAQDKLGALQDPTIAQNVWNDVQRMVAANQPVDPATILNLRNIYYAAHVEAGGGVTGNPPTPPIVPTVTNTPPPVPYFGRSTFPGAGAAPYRPAAPDPNAPRTVLDPATEAAINAVKNAWSTKPSNPTGKPNR